MSGYKVVLCLVLAGVAVTYAANDIPALCKEASVTPVSCASFDPNGDGLLVHPDNAHLFYYCVDTDQAPICRQCPAGLRFSKETHVCEYSE